MELSKIENLNDEIIVTVIATGFEDSEKSKVTASAQRENIQSSDDDDDDGDNDLPPFLRKRGF